MSENMLRDACMRPFDMGWEAPTGDEIRQVLKKAGLSGVQAAKLTGVKEGRTVRRWTGEESEIPYSCWAILCEVAGFGMIWKK